MEKPPIISIVVAIYNIESYIADCIKSCINQQDAVEASYEIIIVNDGSTDNSLRLAEAAIKGVKNARIITQENAGVSVARNTGIDQAKGDYLWFVDGDDKLEPHAVRTLLDEINKTACDIYIFNYEAFNSEGVVETSHFLRYDEPLTGKYINEGLGRRLPSLVWSAIYRRGFLKLNKLYFTPGIRHEDDEFTLRVNYLAESILILDECLYQYRVSLSNSFMSKASKDNTASFVSRIKIREILNVFFGKDSKFYNREKANEAFILISYRYYESFNPQNKELYNKVKWGLYADVLLYGNIKRKLFVLLSICLSASIVKKIFKLTR